METVSEWLSGGTLTAGLFPKTTVGILRAARLEEAASDGAVCHF